MKASVFIATSLDGFIARENGDIDWLMGDEEESEEDYGFEEFMDTVDYLVMGRNTFEKVLSFDEWLYGDTPVVVLTHREPEIPERLTGSVEVMSGSPGEIVHRLSARGAEHLYIDGGKTIQGFLRAGLIQRLTISTIPVLIGTGIPLFGPLSQDIKLTLVKTRQYPGGMIQSEYEVLNTAD